MSTPASEEHGQVTATQQSGLLEASLRLLEFDVVREKLAGHTSFPMSRELAQALRPSTDHAQVARWLEEAEEARRILDKGVAVELGAAADLRPTLQRAALRGVLSGEELRDLAETLKAARQARAALLRQEDVPRLRSVAQDIPPSPELELEIAGSIGGSGEVLDGASTLLRELRSQSRDAQQRLMDSLERTMRRLRRQNILQEPVITQRNGRMVLLVKTEMKHRLNGIVHDVSDSGATLFVEPMGAVSLGNDWRELQLAQAREEERVLRSLSAEVESRVDDLLLTLDLLAMLDLALAKARFARAINATTPKVVEGDRQYIRLVDARHPLLEGEAVPISVELGEGWSLLLITGPNAGGKTVALKTVGLLTLMAQAGLPVPAREATFSLYDGVYADIGDQQSIQQSLSTFSSHMQNLRAIMERVTGKSLVLIDELGTSTDPEEGAALAKALLLHFHRRGVSLIATTHQRDVSAFVQEQTGMMNASVELEPGTLAPTYRLTLGLPGSSYALAIAARLGLDPETVEEARALLGPSRRQSEDLLKQLQAERSLAEQLRKEAEQALADVKKERADLEEKLASIQDRASEMAEEARQKLQSRTDEVNARLRAAERTAERVAERPPTRDQWTGEHPQTAVEEPELPASIPEARAEVAGVREELRSPGWQPPPSRRREWLQGLRPGDRVYLRGIPQPVEVVTPPGEGGTVEVLLGTMRARLPVYQLDRPARAHTTSSREGVYYTPASRRQVSTELDLHGVRVEEALQQLEAFIDQATLAGLSSVKVLHGVGTGALRNAIREHLSHHPLVKSSGRDENLLSDSVTVVELN